MDDMNQIHEFSFADIVEDDAPASKSSAMGNVEQEWDETPEWLRDESEEDGEFEEEFEGEVESEEDEDTFGSTLEEVASNFDTIDDSVEFTIGGEKVTKADIAEVVRDRADLREAREGLNSYISNLSEVELRISTYIQASMTETETRLRQVELMLENPDRMTPSDIQKALVAKKDLTARQVQLEQNASKVRAEEEQRRQQLDLVKINQTNAELRASLPGYKGIQTLQEVATWAQKEGIGEDALRSGMSPALIKALLDAKTYREKTSGKKAIRANVEKRMAPKSTSSKAKPRSSAISASSRQKAYERAQAAGDISAMFNLLED